MAVSVKQVEDVNKMQNGLRLYVHKDAKFEVYAVAVDEWDVVKLLADLRMHGDSMGVMTVKNDVADRFMLMSGGKLVSLHEVATHASASCVLAVVPASDTTRVRAMPDFAIRGGW